MASAKVLEGDVQNKLTSLRRSRATHKRKVKLHLKKIEELHTNNTLTSSLFKRSFKEIESEKEFIFKYDRDINSFMDDNDLDSKASDIYENELADQTDYVMNLNVELETYDFLLKENSDPVCNPLSSKDLLDLAVQLNANEGKPPPLDCGTFNGKGKDKFAFSNFLSQFKSVIGDKKNMSKSTKLAYLIGYLRDYALSVVKHLSITDDNYDVALNMLTKEIS